MAKNKSQYDSTLNLPKTLFEMRAGLPKKEPVMLKDWDDNDLYNQLMKHNEGKGTPIRSVPSFRWSGMAQSWSKHCWHLWMCHRRKKPRSNPIRH